MSQELDYRAIRRRVEAGVRTRKFRTRVTFLIVTCFIFVVFMAIGWGIFLSNGGADVGGGDSPLIGAMIMASMTGFMGILFQAISLALDTKSGEESIREQLIAREINREMLAMGLDESLEDDKRKRSMRLSDDGELEAIEDEPLIDADEARPMYR